MSGVTPPAIKLDDGHGGISADDAAFLVRYLRHHAAPCPKCGYDLHGLESPRCPECGELLRVTVGLTYPHLRGWLWLAIPMIGAAGIGLLFLILFAARGMFMWHRATVRFALVYCWLAMPTAALVVLGRRILLRMSTGVQAVLAALAWMAFVGALVLMFDRC